MTNEQKYKTAEERVKAFGEFCKNEFCNECNHTDCRLHKQGSAILHCYDAWLAIEADEDKPEPCFFCGGETVKAIKVGGAVVECKCGYHTRFYNTTEIAIAIHNRMARAVRDVKLAHETMNKIENSTIGFLQLREGDDNEYIEALS